MGNKLVTCAACGFQGKVSGRGNWYDVHRDCPKKDQHTDETPGCPIHGNNLVWTVGPYSTFKECHAKASCGAGRDRRGHATAFRVYPDKNSNAVPTPKPEPLHTTTEPAPPTPPTEPPMPAFVAESPMPALAAYGPLGDAIAHYVESRARTLASELLADALSKQALTPATIQWTVNDQPFAKVEDTAHKAVAVILRKIAAGFRNFFLVGPAGTGKTTIASTLASALNEGKGVAWGELSLSGGIGESRLLGRSTPDLTGGPERYESAPFVEIYEHGGVFLIDECDRGDANTLTCLNSATANGHMAIPRRDKPIATRHPDTIILCSGNTYGTGGDRQYVGANQLDAAFLDRFVGATIDVDYDRDLEARLVGDAHICARVWSIREKVAALKLRRIVGTRFLIAVTRLVKAADYTLDAAILDCTAGWTTDERTKVGVAS